MIMRKIDAQMETEDLVIGIDPGSRTGLSVFYRGKEIESSSYSSIEVLVAHLTEVISGLDARRKLIRIGSGEMRIAGRIEKMLNLEFPSGFEIEFVDESGTSPKIKNCNQRGKRDRLAARRISQREGRKK